MPKYLVERRLPGLTEQQLKAAAMRAKVSTSQMTQEGTPVRYLRSMYIPGEEKCFCLFEAASADVVKQANERAQLPMQHIFEAVHVSSEDLD